jgi:hypothetical protein
MSRRERIPKLNVLVRASSNLPDWLTDWQTRERVIDNGMGYGLLSQVRTKQEWNNRLWNNREYL